MIRVQCTAKKDQQRHVSIKYCIILSVRNRIPLAAMVTKYSCRLTITEHACVAQLPWAESVDLPHWETLLCGYPPYGHPFGTTAGPAEGHLTQRALFVESSWTIVLGMSTKPSSKISAYGRAINHSWEAFGCCLDSAVRLRNPNNIQTTSKLKPSQFWAASISQRLCRVTLIRTDLFAVWMLLGCCLDMAELNSNSQQTHQIMWIFYLKSSRVVGGVPRMR